jgi:hypothetical protein
MRRGRMANANPVIPIEKVCDVLKSISAMGVWGTITFNFQEGEVTQINDNFVWKAGELEKPDFVTGPLEQIKKLHPSVKKRMVIRTGA